MNNIKVSNSKGQLFPSAADVLSHAAAHELRNGDEVTFGTLSNACRYRAGRARVVHRTALMHLL